MNPLHAQRKIIRLLAGAFLVFLGGQASSLLAQSGSNSFWQAQSIYQIFTDRFFDGDTANNNASGSYNATSGTGVHGGDFRGIEQKLDYIRALGATAIWISPIVKNGSGEYHGYSGADFYSVDPHWGTLSNLQVMVNAAHAKGLLVIQDVVVNHGSTLNNINGNTAFTTNGYTLTYASSSKKYAAPFNTNAANPSLSNLFHNYGAIQDYNNTQQVELGELSGLDDFRTETVYVRTNMAAVYGYWITNAGFDGFRVDTVKHCEMGLWQDWCPRIHSAAAANGKTNFFMFGEVYDGSETKVGSYSGTNGGGAFKLDSLLDYPLFFAAQNVFEWGGNTKQIEDHYNALAANYDPNTQNQLVTFLDNHDTTRFLNSANANGDTNRLAVALEFLYTSRGIPCLYQGTEQAFNGGADPNNREDMFAGQFKDAGQAGVDSFNMSHPLFQLVAKLNNFRRLYPALALGTHVNQWNNPNGAGLFAYARRWGTQEVFVVFNTSNAVQVLPSRNLTYAPGTKLVNLLDTNELLTVTAGSQTPLISVPAVTAKIFIAQAQLLPLDPVVVSNSPAHGVANVPTATAITLRFSKPMDTNSVQAAFSISPAASGVIVWSAARDTLTFTAAGAGLPGLTNIFVRLTNSAVDAVSGNALVAPYELKFKTSASSFVDTSPPTISIQTPTNSAVIAGGLTISGTATDNIAVAKVEVRFDSGAWVTASGTNAWSLNLNSSNFLNGPHQLFARATDTSGNVSSTNSVSGRFFNVPGNYLQRLSGGNPSNVVDCSANSWLKDAAYSFGAFGYSGGTTGNVASAISGLCASAQSLYQREHYSTATNGFFYEFDCPAGVYETTLLEAETFWTTAGKRVFNVFIQGQPVLTNFDIFAAAGGQNIPLTRVFTNAVTNAQLQILFAPITDNARVSGVQVRKIADMFSDTDGIPDWWRLAYFSHALGSAADNSRGSDDADGDGVSNLTEFLNGSDPLKAASFPTGPVFGITDILLVGNDVQLSFSGAANWTFQLQRRDTLDSSTTWANVGAAQSGSGGGLGLADSGGATNFARFYRIQAR